MIFDHVYKYKGVYYNAGENVPCDVDKVESLETETPIFLDSKKGYEAEELNKLSVKEIKKIASDLGIEIKKNSPKADVIAEFLSKQQ